jgi:metal-sulfur cluster biosynthetic enzyme
MAVTETSVMEALKQVIDPELGIDIVALGLIYEVLINSNEVTIQMTLTTPGCPLAPVIDQLIQEKVGAVDGVTKISLDLVWDPPWTPQMMSENVRAEFGFD